MIGIYLLILSSIRIPIILFTSVDNNGIRWQPSHSCRNCRNPPALGDDLVSKNFMARSGQADMFQHTMNIVLGPKQDRQLLTGLYSIAEIYCSKGGEELGWKYVQAYDFKNRYKEGKFIYSRRT